MPPGKRILGCSGTKDSGRTAGFFSTIAIPFIICLRLTAGLERHDQPGCRLTAPIGGVAPRRHQQRHVEMALRIADRKAQRDLIEERRVRRRHAPVGKIAAELEGQLIATDRHWSATDQWLVGAAVGIGDGARNQATDAKFGQFDQLDARCLRPAGRYGYRAHGSTAAPAP